MIFLNILRIIGIILLVLVLIFLLVILAILFVPVRYRILINSNPNYHGNAKVHWLFHVISLKAFWDFKTSDVNYSLKILGFKLYPKKIKESTLINNEADLIYEPLDFSDKDDNEECKDANEQPSDCIKEDIKPKFKEKILSIKNRVLLFINKVKGLYNKWQKIIADPYNKKAVKTIKIELKNIINKIMPKRMMINAKYSLGSPDKTAIILGVISMFPIGYQNKWNVYPDFESETYYFDGEGYINGRIHAYQILFPGIRLFFNKEIRRLLKKVFK